MTTEQTPRQLTLLPSPAVPVQFRLDSQTRRRGMRHVAEIRQYLANRETVYSSVRPTADQSPKRQAAA